MQRLRSRGALFLGSALFHLLFQASLINVTNPQTVSPYYKPSFGEVPKSRILCGYLGKCPFGGHSASWCDLPGRHLAKNSVLPDCSCSFCIQTFQDLNRKSPRCPTCAVYSRFDQSNLLTGWGTAAGGRGAERRPGRWAAVNPKPLCADRPELLA